MPGTKRGTARVADPPDMPECVSFWMLSVVDSRVGAAVLDGELVGVDPLEQGRRVRLDHHLESHRAYMSTCCLYGLIMHDHHETQGITHILRMKLIMVRPI